MDNSTIEERYYNILKSVTLNWHEISQNPEIMECLTPERNSVYRKLRRADKEANISTIQARAFSFLAMILIETIRVESQ